MACPMLSKVRQRTPFLSFELGGGGTFNEGRARQGLVVPYAVPLSPQIVEKPQATRGRQLTYWQLYGGQPAPPPLKPGRITKADHGQLVRDSNAKLLDRLN